MTSRIEEEKILAYSLSEWESILWVARQRQDMNVADELHERYGKSDDYAHALRKHELGVLGEFTLCRHKKLPWLSALDRFAVADVGSIYQVRCVDLAARKRSSLITHPKDRDGQVFVLAVADFELFTVTLKGWLYGRDAKALGIWRTDVPNAAFFTGDIHLHGMDSLPSEALA